MSALKWITAGAESHACGGALIWLHGLGADGYDFAPVIPSLGLHASLRLRFIFPHAPVMPVTINGGMMMPAWYDILTPDLSERPDWVGIMRSVTQVHVLIERLIQEGVASDSICLAGFSQGGLIAMMTALTAPIAIRGCVILSSYLPTLPSQYVNQAFAETMPLFLGHGQQDTLVPIHLGRATQEVLSQKGAVVDWHDYPIGHQVCEEELRDIGAFLNRLW